MSRLLSPDVLIKSFFVKTDTFERTYVHNNYLWQYRLVWLGVVKSPEVSSNTFRCHFMQFDRFCHIKQLKVHCRSRVPRSTRGINLFYNFLSFYLYRERVQNCTWHILMDLRTCLTFFAHFSESISNA